MTAALPKTVANAISGSVSVMLASLAIPKERTDAALAAFFDELNGAGTRMLTNPEPLDRAIKPKQAAEILARSPATVKRMVRDGKLRGIYGGASAQRLTGISEKSVRDFMQNGRAA